MDVTIKEQSTKPAPTWDNVSVKKVTRELNVMCARKITIVLMPLALVKFHFATLILIHNIEKYVLCDIFSM